MIQLESERSNARRIALLAGLVTLVPMAVLIARGGTDAFQAGDHLVLIFGIALVGAASATGALIGATNPDLHRIYP